MTALHAFLRPVAGLTALGVGVAGAMLATDQLWLLALGVVFACLCYLAWSAVPPVVPRRQTTPDEREEAGHDQLRHSVQLLAGFLLAGFLTLGLHMFRQQVAQADAIANTRVINETTRLDSGLYQRDTTVIRNGR